MIEPNGVPDDFRRGYGRLLTELVKIFSLDKRSGKVELHFLEGNPKELKDPSFNVRLDR